MSWQDDLRQLDQALADGRISADGYRQRRDQILADYSSGPAGAPTPDYAARPSAGEPEPTPAQPGPPQPPQPLGPPSPPAGFEYPPPGYGPPPGAPPGSAQGDRGQPGPGPFAPPFRWTSTSPGANQRPGGEATQVVPGGRDNSAEKTQIVSGVSEVDRTQAFRPVPGAPPSGNQQGPGGLPPNQQRQPWGTGMDSAPPWGGGGVSTPTPNWLTQGPEVFETSGRGSRTKIALIAVGVVVVLGLGAGGYFLFNHGGSHQASGGGAAATTTQPTTTKPKPKPKPAHPDEPLLDQLPPVVGTVNARGAVFNSDTDMLSKGLIDEATANMYSAAGVQQVAWRDGSKAADQFGPTADYFTVQAISLGGPDNAAQLAQNIQHFQETHEFVRVPSVPSVPSNVVIEKNVTDKVTRYRGIWVVGNDVIWVSVEQQPLTSESALTTSFEREIQALLPSFPAE